MTSIDRTQGAQVPQDPGTKQDAFSFEPSADAVAESAVGSATLGRTAAAPARPAGRRIAGNLTFLAAAEGAARSLTLVTSVVTARALGPAKLGEVAFAMTLSVFFSAIADGGLTLLTYRRIVAEPNRLSRLVADTTAVQVGLSLVLGGILVAIALGAPLDVGHRKVLIVFAPYVITQGLSVIYALQALERMGWVALIKVITQLLTTIPTAALVIITHDPVWVAGGLVFGQLCGDLIIAGVLRRTHRFRFVMPNLGEAIPLLRDGRALLGILLVFNYAAAIDTITLSILRSSHQVGEYNAATGVAGTAGILSQILTVAVLPELVRRHGRSLEQFREFVDKLIGLVARLTLAGSAIFIVDAGPFVHFLYGHKYGQSGLLLTILMVGVPVLWYAHVLGFAQVAASRQRDFFIALTAASVIATFSYPVLTAQFGATGLAGAGVFIALTQAVVVTFGAIRHLKLSPMIPAFRQLPYALVPIALVLVVNAISGHRSLPAGIVVWLGGILAVELSAHGPTAGFIASIRRPRASRG